MFAALGAVSSQPSLPIIVAESLREQYSCLPVDQRRPLSEAQRDHPRFNFTTHMRSEGDPWIEAKHAPESPADLSARCAEVLQMLRRCPSPRILVVAHERVLRHLLSESGLHVVPLPPQSHDAAAAVAAAGGMVPERIRPFESCDLRSYAVGGWT